MQQRNGCDQFKFRGVFRHGLRNRAHLLCQSRQIPVRDHLSIHPHTLMKIHKIGRGIQSHPVARRLQYGGNTGTGTAFAIGTRYMDKLLPALRISQCTEQRPDPVQPRRMPLPLKGVNIGDGLLSSHGAASSPYARARPWRRSSPAMGRATVATMTAISIPDPSRYSSSPKT